MADPYATLNPFDPRLNPFQSMERAKEVLQAQQPASTAPAIGEERTIPIGAQVYTGPNYGWQTPRSVEKITPARASRDPLERAYFAELQRNVKAGSAGEKPKEDQRGQNVPTSTGQPSQQPAAQKTDPEIDEYNRILRELALNPELRAKLAAQDTAEFIKRSLVTQSLALQQSRENTKRQVELQNIQAWRDLERARYETNARMAMAFGQTVASSLVPNQGLMSEMNKAFSSAMVPFSDFNLRG